MESTPDLGSFDWILINTSGGKDSSVAAWFVVKRARELGILDRVRAVHATFPEEWQDAENVCRRQCEQLGIPVEVVSRGESLLDYVRRRQMWPSSKARYCTSDFKRAPIDKVITHLPAPAGRKTRVLNVMGLRSQESPARAKKTPYERDNRRSNSKRDVYTWLPIFAWSESDVWSLIREEKIPSGCCYDLGFTRMSCRICIFANRNTLLAAAEKHPELFKAYVDVEKEIGHTFKADLALGDVWKAHQDGERASGPLTFSNAL